MQTLSREEAQYCADTFSNYFDQFTRIDEYMRDQKMAQIDSIPQSLPGMGFDADMFDDFTMSPEDMDLEVLELDNSSSVYNLDLQYYLLWHKRTTDRLFYNLHVHWHQNSFQASQLWVTN